MPAAAAAHLSDSPPCQRGYASRGQSSRLGCAPVPRTQYGLDSLTPEVSAVRGATSLPRPVGAATSTLGERRPPVSRSCARQRAQPVEPRTVRLCGCRVTACGASPGWPGSFREGSAPRRSAPRHSSAARDHSVRRHLGASAARCVSRQRTAIARPHPVARGASDPASPPLPRNEWLNRVQARGTGVGWSGASRRACARPLPTGGPRCVLFSAAAQGRLETSALGSGLEETVDLRHAVGLPCARARPPAARAAV
jgi:hypothetical protein